MNNSCQLCYKITNNENIVRSGNSASCLDCLDDCMEMGRSMSIFGFQIFILNLNLRKISNVVSDINTDIKSASIKNIFLDISEQLEILNKKYSDNSININDRDKVRLYKVLDEFESLVDVYCLNSNQSFEELKIHLNKRSKYFGQQN